MKPCSLVMKTYPPGPNCCDTDAIVTPFITIINNIDFIIIFIIQVVIYIAITDFLYKRSNDNNKNNKNNNIIKIIKEIKYLL